MAPPNDERTPETKAEAEALIPHFQLEKVLSQDQNGRRITLLGQIHSLSALLTLERAAFPSDQKIISQFLTSLTNTTNLGANDVYRWYMSNHTSSSPSTTTTTTTPQSTLPSTLSVTNNTSQPQSTRPTIPDLKLNLIYPCTSQHIRKYTPQRIRMVTETPEIYATHIKPWVKRTQRTPKRLDWIYNILDGITEQEDVVYRSPGFGLKSSSTSSSSTTTVTIANDSKESDIKSGGEESGGFLLLPDLNWDRKTVRGGLHLLALVERRDIWSVRDLKCRDIAWLKKLRGDVVREAARHGSELLRRYAGDDEEKVVDEDEIKCYIHYQPTYHHFHIHAVHIKLEPEGPTQSVGKAFSLENIISQLENMAQLASLSSRSDGLKFGKDVLSKEADRLGMHNVSLTYFIGEESDVWKKCFARVKIGERVDLNDDDDVDG